jgi:hypothetical protein
MGDVAGGRRRARGGVSYLRARPRGAFNNRRHETLDNERWLTCRPGQEKRYRVSLFDQSSVASRRAAGAFGFFIFSQS